MHYKESLFCLSRLRMRPRYWIKRMCSLFNCFQVWKALPSDIHMASLMCLLKCHFLERFSLFITASPLLPRSFLSLYFSSWPQLLNHVYSFISYLRTLKCELHENRDPKGTKQPALFMVQSPHGEQCLEQRTCSLNVHWLRGRNFLEFCKGFSIMLLYFL